MRCEQVEKTLAAVWCVVKCIYGETVESSHRDHGLVRKRSHAGYGCIRAVVGGKRRCQLQTLPTDANVFSVLELLDLPPMIPSPKTFRRQEEYPNGISLFAS